MTIKEQLDEINGQFEHALAIPDAAAIADHYTEDAVFLQAGEPTTVGRQAILAKFQKLPGPMSLTFVTGEIIEDGDLVVDIGWLRTGDVEFGRYVVVYRRQSDGRLKLAVDVPLRYAET